MLDDVQRSFQHGERSQEGLRGNYREDAEAFRDVQAEYKKERELLNNAWA